MQISTGCIAGWAQALPAAAAAADAQAPEYGLVAFSVVCVHATQGHHCSIARPGRSCMSQQDLSWELTCGCVPMTGMSKCLSIAQQALKKTAYAICR